MYNCTPNWAQQIFIEIKASLILPQNDLINKTWNVTIRNNHIEVTFYRLA